MKITDIITEVGLYKQGITPRMLDRQFFYLNSGDHKETAKGKVGKFNLSTVDEPGQHITYVLRTKKNDIIAFLMLDIIPGWRAKEESLVWVDEKYRGQGLVYELYDYFIKKEGGILISDDLHSPDAIRMWKKFVQQNRYKIY